MTIFKDRMGKTLGPSQVASKGLIRIYNYFADFFLFWLNLLVNIPSHHIRRLLMRLYGANIGKGTSIHMGAHFYSLKNLKIGKDSIVGSGVFLDGRDKLIIGDHVSIASEAMIYNSEHDIHSDDFHHILEPVEIGDYVFIGPRAIILPGVKIGRGAVVAAGGVVTKDVLEFSVVGGVPAVVLGERKNKDPHYKIGRARLFQ